MHDHRHLVGPAHLEEHSLELEGDDAHHLLRVVRAKPGQKVELFDGAGRTALAAVARCGRRSLTLERLEEPRFTPPPRCRITLFLCVCKSKRMDWAIEKAGELGADCVQPLYSRRSVPDPGGARGVAEKRERWQRIAAEATRQCGGAWLPRVQPPLTLAEALPLLAVTRPLFVGALAEDTEPLATLIQRQERPSQAGWMVGPEGDFTAEELESLRAAGGLLADLGPRVLRVETAAVYGLVCLRALWG